jgi:hypothetical protein
MTKHRKDWTEWGRKKAAEHRQRRAFQAIMAKMIMNMADETITSGLMAQMMRPTPFFTGAKIRVPIRYEKLK